MKYYFYKVDNQNIIYRSENLFLVNKIINGKIEKEFSFLFHREIFDQKEWKNITPHMIEFVKAHHRLINDKVLSEQLNISLYKLQKIKMLIRGSVEIETLDQSQENSNYNSLIDI